MSLLDRVGGPGEGPGSGATRRWSRLRSGLRDSLVDRLGYREIARMADEGDAQRAREELWVTLSAVMNEGGFESLTEEERRALADEVCDDIVGLGPLEVFMADDEVSEVMVNGTQSLYYEKEGRLQKADRVFESDEQIRAAIERIIAPVGRRIDEQSPLVNARLKNGYRVNAVIPPVAVDVHLVKRR